ncbi:MAG: hypothetical protein AAF937_00450 [Planctomycetota bacterium]
MPENDEDASSIECVECSIRLPIRISKEPDAVRIRCRFCGSVYRGTLPRTSVDELLANIEVLESAAD